MDVKEWVIQNIKDFQMSIKSEEAMKIKVLEPFLHSIGYEKEDMDFDCPIPVHVGTKKVTVFADIIVKINDRIEMVIETKRPSKTLTEQDMLQAISYAKLIGTPSALYSVVTNGVECITQNVVNGMTQKGIPTKNKLLADINKAKRDQILDIEIKNEAEKVLFTLNNRKELYKVIQTSKDIIEKRALIRSDQSFREMTKIILVKMNEERRVKAREGKNRFTFDHIKKMATLNECMEIDIFRKLFEEAKTTYPNIYTNEDESININDNLCITQLIKKLEPFSFLGTGDDIKGTVYEIFLKTTLRGEFDQYFTPRELVEFMVRCADPDVDDKILDPACGSGGFLIQAFRYVNQKINASGLPEIDNIKMFRKLIDKNLWGHEADYDLHVLAKINLIMHGDGWNNIYQGDTLKSENLQENSFDIILENPPFTIPYTFEDVIGRFELGIGKKSEELDILFFEKSIRLLKPGRDMFIILPEGLLNIKKYKYFREWLLKKTDVLMSISLPEGAFIPFGGSVSKTCIIGVRKKGGVGYISPKHCFLAKAVEIGYELGKKVYLPKLKNDLRDFENYYQELFHGVKKTENEGECGWIKQNEIDSYRLDANFLLNKIDRERIKEKFKKLVPLTAVCQIENKSIKIDGEAEYYYLEVPDISSETGTITNIRKKYGRELKGDSYYKFFGGDILFSRINPRKNRVSIAPPIHGFGIVSKEVYNIKYKKNELIPEAYKYVICPILQSEFVNNQIVRLSTGSSSSRARVQEEDLLNDVYIPIPEIEEQKKISKTIFQETVDLWKLSQRYLNHFANIQGQLGSSINRNNLRRL